jgi:4-hydroxyphenylpyruvate dioxygenase
MVVSTSSAPLVTAAPADQITGWDHLELWVGNSRAFAHFLHAGLGFAVTGYSGPETGVRDRSSYVLEQGGIRLVVTAGQAPDSPITRSVAEHGDGVRSIALTVGDVDAATEAAARRGAAVVHEPDDEAGEGGVVRSAAIALYGDTVLRFVDRSRHRAGFGPGFTAERLPGAATGRPVGLEAIDHVVGNVEEGHLDMWVAWFEEVMGFGQMRHFDEAQISTEHSALRSTVMWNGGAIVMPLNEPAPGLRKSQIEEYLDAHRGPGVQHVALATRDIVHAVDELHRRGMRFLQPPPAYYAQARERCAGLDLDWPELERLGVLVDIESGGHLLQVFSEPLGDRPTLFVEVIQRAGARGFGEGNFKALFEALELEQSRRGNL